MRPDSSTPRQIDQSILSKWILRVMDSASNHGRYWAVSIILVLVLLVGWADYLINVRVSLTPFYIPIIMLSVIWLGWVNGILWAIACVIVKLVGDLSMHGLPRHWEPFFWNRFANFLTYLIIIAVVHALARLLNSLETQVRERTQALEDIIRQREGLQQQLFEISRRERSTIGHELHDGLGQHLTATSFAAKLLGDHLAKENHPRKEDARKIQDLVKEAINQTRQIAKGLLLAEVDPGQFEEVLEELVASVQRDRGIVCELHLKGALPSLNISQSSHLYYIVQEATRNAMRHANAGRIVIEIEGSPSALNIRVSDDGKGIPANNATPAGMGLKIMDHRASLIGARFSIEPNPPRGTRVCCHLKTTLQLGQMT